MCHKHKLDLVEIKDGSVAGEDVELVGLRGAKIKRTQQYEHSFYEEISEMIEKIFCRGILGDIYLEEAQEK